mmetsp:Transcript_40925/g.80309  ORF Transcript_40925/g.80309 Transcript_40925/m.80309 type:complete len:1149 (-) Transcript_40925:51-3497(-)
MSKKTERSDTKMLGRTTQRVQSLNAVQLMRLAPVARQLVEEVLYHLLLIVHRAHSSKEQSTDGQAITQKDTECEKDALLSESPNTGLLLWLFSLFDDVLRSKDNRLADAGETRCTGLSTPLSPIAAIPQSSSHNLLLPLLYSKQVVDLLLRVIAIGPANMRLSFVRALSNMIKLGVPISSQQVQPLFERADRLYAAQSTKRCFSAFLQALVELCLSYTKRNQGRQIKVVAPKLGSSYKPLPGNSRDVRTLVVGREDTRGSLQKSNGPGRDLQPVSSQTALLLKKKMDEEQKKDQETQRVETKNNSSREDCPNGTAGNRSERVTESSPSNSSEPTGQPVTIAGSHWFQQVVLVEKLVDCVRNGTHLPPAFTLEVWESVCRWPSKRKEFGPILAETGGAHNLTLVNLAALEGSCVFSTGSLNALHDANNVVNGTYGNENSWIPAANAQQVYGKQFVGIRFGSASVVTSVAWGRANGKSNSDRCLGDYTLQVTRADHPDESTPDVFWHTVMTVKYTASFPSQPSNRHRWVLRSSTCPVTAVRLVVSSATDESLCIDEFEVYGNHTFNNDQAINNQVEQKLNTAVERAVTKDEVSLEAHKEQTWFHEPKDMAFFPEEVKALQICQPKCRPEVDAELVRLLNLREDQGLIQADKFQLTTSEKLQHGRLAELDLFELQLRVQILVTMNKWISECLPLINFDLPSDTLLLAEGVKAVRHLLFWSIKDKLFQAALKATEVAADPPQLALDAFLSVKLFEQRKTDFRGTRSLFSQAFRALDSASPTLFRIPQNARAWTTIMGGFAAIDAGGPYRDAIETMCKELQSPVLPLFTKSPNARGSIGENRDSYIPRPSSTSRLYLSMYKFLGKLMGLSFRSACYLPLNFPSILWKPLVNDKVTINDVKAIDELAFSVLEEIEQVANTPNMTPWQFEEFTNQAFTAIGSDQKVHPLCKGGNEIKVTLENFEQFKRLYLEFRLNEFAIQTDSIRKGLATVLPYRLLNLFTAQQLEAQVCGRATFDVDLLEKMTTYSGCSASDHHIKLFWRMMREKFDDQDRAAFLSFAWGRSRLPLTAAGFPEKFKISRHHKSDANPNRYCPIAHTCFFRVEMPRYTSLQAMQARVMYAMTQCTSIDTDGTVNRTAAIADVEGDDEEGSLFDS